MNATPRLKRDNHFLPVCYQKGFADSSGRVWVRFANRGHSVHWHPSRVGKQRDFYIRTTAGIEDDRLEDFFNKQVESDFAKLSRRVKAERDQLSSITGTELGTLGRFVASQVVRTLANKLCMERQVGRPLNASEFSTEMVKQWKAILRSWLSKLPAFDFYTSLPYVEERFITGDNPVLVVVDNDNTIWVPRDEPHQRITSPQYLLSSPNTSFRVALSSYICVVLRVHGAGETRLPPQTMEPMQVRWFNARIREQCRLFVLARDETSLM